MRNTVTLLVAAAAAVAGLHYYRTTRVPAAATVAEAATGPGGGGGAAAPAPAPAPAAPATPAEPGARPAGPRERGPAARGARPEASADALDRAGVGDGALYREALTGDDVLRSTLLLYRVAREYPDGSYKQDAVARLRALEDEGAAKGRAVEAERPDNARLAYSVAYLACLDAARRKTYKEALDRLAAQVVFSRRDFPADAFFHAVAKGDSLQKIAARYDFPAEGIQRINGVRGTSIRIGERLKVPRGPVTILVSKAEFRLVLLFGGRFVKEFPIGTGREGSTPEAVFTVETKLVEPTWYSREGTFPFGHPKNILGTRWLGFRDTDAHRGFGIHGTSLPDSIGREESSGCIRMRNGDVEELFGYVPRNAQVTITR